MRFFAAASVVAGHVLYQTAPDSEVWRHYPLGIGVSFFFVLSGFVLTWAYDPTMSVRGFYLRRFARIYPLHAVTWLVAFLVVDPELAGKARRALLLVQVWSGKQTDAFAMNSVSWSLGCEAFFYACCRSSPRSCSGSATKESCSPRPAPACGWAAPASSRSRGSA